jgi:ankyrin repeat protein
VAEALIEAGADLNFQKDGKGDTPLIGAASLGAEDVGIRLLDAGANPLLRGCSERPHSIGLQCWARII